MFFSFSFSTFLKKKVSSFLFSCISFKYVLLLALVSEFNCFLCSRCFMEMWCLDDIGRDSWDWVGPPAWVRACFNSPEWGGGPDCIVVVLVVAVVVVLLCLLLSWLVGWLVGLLVGCLVVVGCWLLVVVVRSVVSQVRLRAAQGVVFARVPPTTLVLDTPHTQSPILDQSRSHIPCCEHSWAEQTTGLEQCGWK